MVQLPREGVAPRQTSVRKLQSGAPLDQHRTDRTCAEEGCKARLSRYNPTERCGLHAGWRDPADTVPKR